MHLSPLEQRLYEALAAFEIIDAHEHLSPESVRLAEPVDVFTLFSHYTRRDLELAGMSSADYQALFDRTRPLDERWQLFAPYWERIRFTSYARAARLAARRFCGVEDIGEDTYVTISERLAAGNTPGLYDRVLGEACHIRTALTQCQRTDLGTPLLTPVMPLGPWGVSTWKDLLEAEQGTPGATNSLEDYLAAQRAYILRVKSEGAVGLKILVSPYGPVDRAEARACFENLRTGTVKELPPNNPLRDFVLDESLRVAGEQELVVCVHTGYWGDFRQLDPLHLIPLLPRHPTVRFDVYHVGYPWMRPALMLGKGFPNVWLNFCWTHIISQRFAMDALDEAIDLLPSTKVLGFGGDYGVPVEKVYGHLVMAREDMARVLAARVERGTMTEEQAVEMAHQWLWDNPRDLYRLNL